LHTHVSRPHERISWQAYALNWVMSLSVRPLLEVSGVSPRTMWLARRAYEVGGAIATRLPHHVRATPAEFDGFDGEWVRTGDKLDESKVMLYLHGGGYFFSSAQQHRPITWRLSRAAGRPVLAINYRMAPDHAFEHWREDAISAYQHLLERGYQPEDILIGGDSAGGHLTLVTLQTLRDRGIPLPRAALCISPWTDLANTSGSHGSNRWRDPMFPSPVVRRLASHYATGRDPYDPLVSPLYGDFTGLPPLMIMAGSTEILRDDARRAAARAREAGVSVVYEEWHRMPHVFPIFAFFIPEGRKAYRHMARFFGDVERG
jgi:acetyl esterase/lipase